MSKPVRPKTHSRPGYRPKPDRPRDKKVPVDETDDLLLGMPDTFPYKPQLGGPW